MSGGSFNYVSCAQGLAELVKQLDDLIELSDWLSDHATDSKAAADTKELLATIGVLDSVIRQHLTQLGTVWHALEWWVSNDYGEQQFKDAVAEYETSQDRKDSI